MTNQIELEKKYSKRNINRIVRKAIKKDEKLQRMAETFELKIIFWLKDLDTYESKRKRKKVFQEQDIDLTRIVSIVFGAVLKTKEKQHLQAVVGAIEGQMPFCNVWDRVKTAAELLALGNNMGVYYIETYPDKMAEVVPLYQLNHDLYTWINDTQYNLPLVDKPNEVNNNKNCGYHFIKEPLISGGWLKEHNENQDYNTINILNQIEWCLDLDILKEKPALPEKMVGKQKDAFLQAFQVTTQELLKAGNRFYFAWQYDTRGRIYSHGWGVNFQSFEYLKALVNPTYQEKVTK